MRGILFICLALIGGPILIVTGIGEYRNSKKLMADGQATTGSVLKWDETRSRKGRHNYYLTVSFKLADGQEMTKRASVGSEVFAKAVAEQVTEENLATGLIYPPQSRILEASLHVAERVATYIFDKGLARVPRPDDIGGLIHARAYRPVYPE